MLIWRNWQLRNDQLHEKPVPPVHVTRSYLASYMSSLLQIQSNDGRDPIKGKGVADGGFDQSAHKHKAPVHAPWPAPSEGCLAISVDGAFSDKEKDAGVGVIVRDSAGDLVLAACKYMQRCDDPLEAELLAALEGIQMARTYAAGPFVLQTDCLNLIKLVKVQGQDKSRAGQLVSELKALFVEEQELSIMKLDRS